MALYACDERVCVCVCVCAWGVCVQREKLLFTFCLVATTVTSNWCVCCSSHLNFSFRLVMSELSWVSELNICCMVLCTVLNPTNNNNKKEQTKQTKVRIDRGREREQATTKQMQHKHNMSCYEKWETMRERERKARSSLSCCLQPQGWLPQCAFCHTPCSRMCSCGLLHGGALHKTVVRSDTPHLK